MELEIERELSDDERTFGTLWVDGEYESETLEDPVRDEKIPGETAIPAGRYRVTLENSHRFGVDTITINDVPGFAHIRIHAGNTAKDTDGCPLVGQIRTEEGVAKSRPALAHLKKKVQDGLEDGEVWLTIRNANT